jgi:hypothetical protein
MDVPHGIIELFLRRLVGIALEEAQVVVDLARDRAEMLQSLAAELQAGGQLDSGPDRTVAEHDDHAHA